MIEYVHFWMAFFGSGGDIHHLVIDRKVLEETDCVPYRLYRTRRLLVRRSLFLLEMFRTFYRVNGTMFYE